MPNEFCLPPSSLNTLHRCSMTVSSFSSPAPTPAARLTLGVPSSGVSASAVEASVDGSVGVLVDAAAGAPNGLALLSVEACPKENGALAAGAEEVEPKLNPDVLGASSLAAAGAPKLKEDVDPDPDGVEAEPNEKPLFAAVLGVPLGVEDAPKDKEGVEPPGPNLPSLAAGAEDEKENVLGGVEAAAVAVGLDGPNENKPPFDGVDVDATGVGAGGAGVSSSFFSSTPVPLNRAGTCHCLSPLAFCSSAAAPPFAPSAMRSPTSLLVSVSFFLSAGLLPKPKENPPEGAAGSVGTNPPVDCDDDEDAGARSLNDPTAGGATGGAGILATGAGLAAVGVATEAGLVA